MNRPCFISPFAKRDWIFFTGVPDSLLQTLCACLSERQAETM